MAHLGHLLTALADGQLSPAAAEKVLEHVAVCRPCASELAAERRARRLLAEASCAAPPPELAARLRTIAEQPVPAPEPARSHWRAGALVAAGSIVGASALATALFVAGSPRDTEPALSELAALTSLGLVADSPRASATTAAALVLPSSTAAAEDIPEGLFTVTDERTLARGHGAVLELAGRGGHVVLVTQRGRLDAESVAQLEPVEHAGVPVHVIDAEPFHAVWQSGELVVELVTDLPASQVRELVAHFPADEYDEGPIARLARGWSAVTGGASR